MLLDFEMFKKRFRREDSDHCLYVWKYNGRIFYVGCGKWNWRYWYNSRPFHTNCCDLLSNTIDKHWTCEVITGISLKEAKILEAKYISLYEGTLSPWGSMSWDGKSLINKRRELTYNKVRYEVLFKRYLNLEDGSNYWETVRRQINGY